MSEYYFYQWNPQFSIVITDKKSLHFSQDVEDEVEEIWNEQKEYYGERLFNGKILSALSHSPKCLTTTFVEYRYHLAQIHAPHLRPILRVNTVSITGITLCGNEVLIGRRSRQVAEYRDMYELSPSGGVDPAAVEGDSVNIIKQVAIELHEETGIDPKGVIKITPYLLAVHQSEASYEFCAKIEIDPLHKRTVRHNPDEYQSLEWIPRRQLFTFCQQKGNQVVSLTNELATYMFCS